MASSETHASMHEEQHERDHSLECSVCGNEFFFDGVHGPQFEPRANHTCQECMTQQILQSFVSRVEERSEGSNTNSNSSRRILFLITNQNRSHACHMCHGLADIYCPTCDLPFCTHCGGVHHSDETVGTHEVYSIDPESITAANMAPPLEDSSETPQDIDNSARGPAPAIPQTTPVHIVVALLLIMVVTIGVFIHSLPAYTILPPEEVEPVNMICRHRTKEEVKQDTEKSNKQSHRTVCSFNVFHYDLLYRNRTYFVLDIDIDIAKTYRIRRGRLILLKLFHLNKKTKTHHKQRNMYLAVSGCTTAKDELAICLEDVSYKKDAQLTQKVISKVVLQQNKTVSFLFLVDNDEKRMDIFTPVVLWKDVVFLEHYYEGKTLSVWISLANSKHDKYISARIRSGSNIKIGDLPNPAVVTNYQIVNGVLTYPFRCLYAYLGNTFLPAPVQNTNTQEETLGL